MFCGYVATPALACWTFAEGTLAGLTVGIYQHSAVGSDLLTRIISSLGAEAMPLASSDRFMPVDTEAIRPEDIELAKA